MNSDWSKGLLWAEHLCKIGEGFGPVPVKIMLGYANNAAWDFYIAEEITDRWEFIDGAHDYAEHVWQRLKEKTK